ncbi:MAG: hypothetical protein AAFY76_03825 [Cyanobacteria bacterium J06649_11]
MKEESSSQRTSVPKKVGRPRSSVLRDKGMFVRLSESELQEVHRAAEKSGSKTVTSFHRKALMATVRSDTAIHGIDDVRNELRQLAYQVNSAGINLNQLTRAVNEGRLSDDGGLLDVLSAVKEQNTMVMDRMIGLFKQGVS